MADPIYSYSEQTTREEPYMEAMRRGLLQDVRGLQANRFGYNLVDKKDAAGAGGGGQCAAAIAGV